MGKRKSKETESKSLNDASSAQNDIFSTLFSGGGGENKNDAVASLFSDSNPFRRKTNVESPHIDGNRVDDNKEKKKKKRNLEGDEKGNEEEAAVVAAEATVATKKSKKEKNSQTQNANLGSDQEQNPEKSSLESNVVSEERKDAEPDFGEILADTEKKRKKKRKRDDIEKEYEAKKFGVTLEEEEEKKKVGEKRKKADDAADAIVVSKEGFDDESKLLRTVFVGNLPIKAKKKALLKEFSRFGEVESVRIRSVPIVDTKKTRKAAIMQKQINENASSVHAYVVFKTEQAAEASLAHNMSLIGGNHIRVDRACPPRKKLKGESAPLYDPKRTVFVGNLPFDVKDEELYQLFTSIKNLEGSVEAIRVVRDPHLNVGKGIAYVLFKTREAANAVIKKGSLKLRERELRVSHTRSNVTPSKRKNASDAYSPAKKFASDKITSSAGKDSNKSHGKVNLSYQGLRASKSDSKRKLHQKTPASAKMKSNRVKQEKPKEQNDKRPSVAARKAKVKALKEGGIKQAGFKRKQDIRTPESFRQKKKAKRF